MIAAAMTVSMLCTLSGCCKTKTANTTPISNNAESSAAAAETSENLSILEEETGRTESIDKSDYPIKNCKLSGADSLYEIQASDLGLPQLDVKLFAHLGNAIVIGYNDNGTKISVIDPLNLKIKKTLDISFALDHFTPDCDFPRLYVNENGMAIISEKLNKVLFYDSNFEQIEEIPAVRGINPILISADLKKIIWDDENGTETYVYSRDTNETKTVFKKLCAKNPDHFLQAYDPIADQIFYSVEVGTDVCTYHTQAWDLNRETVASDWGDNEISAPYFDGQNLYATISDGLQIQNKDSLKKNVLAFDSETEKMGDSIDWKSKMVCTSDFVTNAAENDITFRAYDFEGYKKYETKLVTEQSDSCLIHAIINDNMNYGLMTVDDGGSSHLYVWDFLADNVQVKEQEKFLYASDSILDDKISHRVDELEKKYGFQVQIVDKETITTFHYEIAPIEDKNKLLNYLNKIKQEYARAQAFTICSSLVSLEKFLEVTIAAEAFDVPIYSILKSLQVSKAFLLSLSDALAGNQYWL